MAIIVSFFNQKGGCTKTTSSMQIGGAIALRKVNTLIVDCDPQGTAARWSSCASPENPFPATVISLSAMGKNMVGEIKKLSQAYDLIILDLPPAVDSEVPWAALLITDLAVIPVIPVLDNIWASEKAKELAINATAINTELKTYFLCSKVGKGTVFDLCMEKLIADNPEIPILKSKIGSRNAFPESQIYGSTVHTLAKKSGAAAVEEVEAATDEILKILNIKAKRYVIKKG